MKAFQQHKVSSIETYRHFRAGKFSRFWLLVLIVMISSGFEIYAAEISLCDLEVRISDAEYGRSFYSIDGRGVQLSAHEEDGGFDSCASFSIPVPANAVLWLGAMPTASEQEEINRIILQGQFEGQRPIVSEIIVSEIIISNDEPPIQSSGLARSNLLPPSETLVFGIDNRVVFTQASQLSCAPGSNAAGIQIRSLFPWPDNMQLHIEASGSGQFVVGVASVVGVANESITEIGVLDLSSQSATETRFALPTTQSPWAALSLLCPSDESVLNLSKVQLLPNAEPIQSNRSAWLWAPEIWQQNAESIWSLRADEQIDEIYITVPVTSDGQVEDIIALREFVYQAGSRGIQVWPVIGDYRDVLPASLPALLTRVEAYSRYNAEANRESQLAGVQLDIEPYLIPGFNLGGGHWRERYLHTIEAVHAVIAGELLVDLVVPVWWGTHPEWGDKLLDELDLADLSITVMNYRTDEERLREGAQPFLRWGLKYNKSVRIALETGSLGDETQKIYEPVATGGRLWKVSLGSVDVLVLLNEVHQGLPGQSYRLVDERTFSAANLTFAGDQSRLNDTANRLMQDWAGWRSFKGIAIHGLDEVYGMKPNDGN
ncbi:MAG: hypothetical protein HQ498_15310 [Pseudohongiella sp.]|nr:hypothetical protein [Pseudohongiella sp.]